MLLLIQIGLPVQDTRKERGGGLTAHCLEMLAHPILYMRNLRFTEGKWCTWDYATGKGQCFQTVLLWSPRHDPLYHTVSSPGPCEAEPWNVHPEVPWLPNQKTSFPGWMWKVMVQMRVWNFLLMGNNDINQGFHNAVSTCISYVNNNYHWHGFFREYELLMPTMQLPKERKKERKEEKGKRKRNFPC